MREDWIECKVDDVIELMKNGSSANQFNKNIGLPITRIETIWNEQIDLQRVKYIEENDDELIEKHGLKFGDILLSHINSDSHLGKTAIFKNQTKILIHGINLLLLRPYNLLSQDFINYQFKFLRVKGKFVDAAQRAVNQSSINQQKLKRFNLKLAPLPIQRAIVSKIEALFSDLDNGIANFKKAQEQLKIYRQAVLKKAFEGGFSITNEELLITSEENQSSDNLPNGWKWVKLGKVIEKPKYGTSKKCDYENGNIGVLRIPNISNGFINDSDLKFAEFSNDEISDLSLIEGDILTIRSNGSVDLVGKCALIKKSEIKYLYAGYLIRLRPIKDFLNSRFLLHLMYSINLRIQIESFAKSTSGVNNINSGELSNLVIPLPPTLEEQNQIVQEIESRLSVCDKVEQSISESIIKAEALRQSILKKAFEGKLLSQAEIEQCKTEADYEPASELLKKIKAEKLAIELEKKKPITKKKSKE